MHFTRVPAYNTCRWKYPQIQVSPLAKMTGTRYPWVYTRVMPYSDSLWLCPYMYIRSLSSVDVPHPLLLIEDWTSGKYLDWIHPLLLIEDWTSESLHLWIEFPIVSFHCSIGYEPCALKLFKVVAIFAHWFSSEPISALSLHYVCQLYIWFLLLQCPFHQTWWIQLPLLGHQDEGTSYV